MASKDKAPFFSIIISTRNRPALFLIALRSVREQSFSDREIVVVIDGSTDANLAQYREIEQQFQDILFFELPHRTNGNGQSYAINYGANKSSGQYLCFLDDDDHWTDSRYLERLFENISACESTVDMHYSNQKAFYADGLERKEDLWIGDLIPKVVSQRKNNEDSYRVDTEFLLTSKGFAHINCSVLRREFFMSIGGMDESIRYENDRDFFLRSIDAAEVILYSPSFMSAHNIPDISRKSNMSTVVSEIERKLFQIRVYDKGITSSKNGQITRFCCKAKMYEMKHIARILAQNQQYRSAVHYARAALLNGFTLRWLAYSIYLWLRSLKSINRAV